MSNLRLFPINLALYKKRLILRTVSIFLINFILLFWTVWNAPKENLLNYLFLCLIVLVAIGLFLNQNFKKQISILKNNYLEINNHILQWYTGTGKCTSINLKRVTKIERDKYRGFDRFIIFEGKNSESIINLLEPEEFQAEIEKYTKLKVEYFDFELRKQIIKGAGFFIPAILGFVFSYLNYLDIRFSFLVLTVNSIFFLVQFSEKRTRGGFSESTVRRSTIILFLVLAFQLLVLFSE